MLFRNDEGRRQMERIGRTQGVNCEKPFGPGADRLGRLNEAREERGLNCPRTSPARPALLEERRQDESLRVLDR
jgi:hypothetical protein